MQSGSYQDVMRMEGFNQGIEICRECLFCGGMNSVELASCVKDEFFRSDDGLFDFVRCTDCGSIWLYNRPCGDRLRNAYRNYYTHEKIASPRIGYAWLRGWIKASYFRTQLAKTATPVDRIFASAIAIAISGWDTSGLNKAMRFAPAPPAKILDFGCGSGQYLLSLKALDYELHGAEYDPHLLGKLADLGIPIHDVVKLSDNSWDSEFDHISLSHVLEHVPDPKSLLYRAFQWLKPGGGLYVELPNADATGLSIFGRFWRGLEAPRHFALPSKAALVDAAERIGFLVDRQHIDSAARNWLWNKSMQAAPQSERPRLAALTASAPPETEANAELLTFVLRKPA